MRRLAQISDLHFGRIDPAVVAGLAEDLAGQSPDLVIASGDLTQRARRSQYAAAAAFIRSLAPPTMVIPGNHDIPLFDVVRRFFFPLHRFRQFFGDDLAPFYRDEEIAVLGINTARSWAWRMKGFWKDGAVSEEQLQLIQERFCGLGPEVFRVLVTHHPFIPPPGERPHGIVGQARQALVVLESCGVDLMLAGHLHLGYSGDVRTHHAAVKRSMLSVQAGTAVSTRRREAANAYNLISIDRDRVVITVRTWTGKAFAPGTVTAYHRVGEAWEREEAVPPSGKASPTR